MDAIVKQNAQIESLVSQVHAEDPFDYSYADVLDRQLEAINAQFQDKVGKIKLLANRAEEGGVSAVNSMEDLIPLLFAHTAYKSYPESWLMESKWDRMGKWLDTVSTNRVPKLDTSGVKNLDEWLALLEEHEHYVSCSSGTTGKCAMMNAVKSDLEFCGAALLQAIRWSKIPVNHDCLILSCGQVASTPRNKATGGPMYAAIADPTIPPILPDAPPITIGGITEMVVLRKKIADGTATPGDIAYYEEQAAAREKSIESVTEQAVEAFIANRHRKLHVTGMLGQMYQVAARLRDRGYTAKDFQENTTFISGGLKRVAVPDNYWDVIFDTFNITRERVCHSYGMQECNTTAVRCSHGRYHTAPWVMMLLLDESGENLIPIPASGEIEGRAAFFDLSMEGRWGGVISGDKIRASWDTCGCGRSSPSVHEDIQRYADMASGDKIACSGTIDAYVRGVT